jgi:hypothetical protein
MVAFAMRVVVTPRMVAETRRFREGGATTIGGDVNGDCVRRLRDGPAQPPVLALQVRITAALSQC